MNVNRILIQCIFNNTRRRLFEAKNDDESYSILNDMTTEIETLEGTQIVQEGTKSKLTEGLELGIKNSKSIYDILDHLEYALLEVTKSNTSQSTIRYKA
jgi:hypothetical protein